MDYTTLRTFADSWVLLAMVIFFVGAVGFTLRPGAAKAHDDAASIPFKESD